MKHNDAKQQQARRQRLDRSEITMLKPQLASPLNWEFQKSLMFSKEAVGFAMAVWLEF